MVIVIPNYEVTSKLADDLLKGLKSKKLKKKQRKKLYKNLKEQIDVQKAARERENKLHNVKMVQQTNTKHPVGAGDGDTYVVA